MIDLFYGLSMVGDIGSALNFFSQNKGYMAKKYACVGLATASLYLSTNIYLTRVNHKHYPDKYDLDYTSIFLKSAAFGFIWPITFVLIADDALSKDRNPEYVDEYFFGKVNKNRLADHFYRFKKEKEKNDSS